MEDKHIHEKEIAEHDNSHVHKVISDQYRRQKAFGITKKCTYFFIGRMIAFVNIIPVRRRKREKAISEAEAKPEASRSTPANTMAIIAEIEGVSTVIPSKMPANWLK